MKLLKVIAILIVMMLIAIISMATFFEAQVEKIFVKKVNSYLVTDLIVKDDISFSLFKDFPNASLTFHKVELRESFPNSKRNMLEADQLSFLFGWMDAFSESYLIRKLEIRNGRLDLRTLHGGKSNYHIFAETTDDASDESFSLKLQEASLLNVLVNYIDEPLEQEITFKIENGKFSGDFGTSRYLLNTDMLIYSQQFYIGETDYLGNKKAVLKLNMDMDFDKGLYAFDKSSLAVEDNTFQMDGTIALHKNYSDYDLVIKGVDLNFATFFQLLPQEYAANFEGLSSKGAFQFETQVKGKYTETQQPGVNVSFDFKDGKLSHNMLDAAVQDLNIKGNFTNGSGGNLQTSRLELSNLDFNLSGKPFQMSLIVKDFENPYIKTQINGQLNLKAFGSMVEEADITRLNGIINFDNIVAEGSLSRFYGSEYDYPTFRGRIKASDVSFKYNNEWINEISAAIAINNGDFSVDHITTKMDKSSWSLTGDILRCSPLLFQGLLKDSIDLLKPAKVDLTLQSDFLNLDELMAYMGEAESEAVDTTATEADAFEITSNQQEYVVGKIKLDIQKAKRNKIEVNDIAGELTFNNRAFIIEQLLLKTMDGQIDMRGDFEVNKKRHLFIKTFIQCDELDMQQLMADFDNFGQTDFTDKNISGTFTGRIYMKAFFDNRLTFNEPKFEMVADVALEDGELLNYEPMKALSRFVKLSELERVRFARLENQIEIKNGRMLIPAMYIKSNVVRMTFSGIHSFKNQILYYVKLNLLDILTGKFRKSNKDVDSIKNKKGGINVYVTMKGDAYDPEIAYMKRREVKKRFEVDDKRQNKDLDRILEEEFNVGRGYIPAGTPPTSGSLQSQFADSLDIGIIQWSDTTDMRLGN